MKWEYARHTAGVMRTEEAKWIRGQNSREQSMRGLVGLHKDLGLILNKMEGRFQQGNDRGFNKITGCCVKNGLQAR